MKQFMLTLSLLLLGFASGGGMAQKLPSGIDSVEIAVSSSWDPIAAKVGKAFGNALGMNVGAKVHITDMSAEQFQQLLHTAQDPQLGTLRISIVRVDPANHLPSYTESLDLVGAVAEEPIAIFEATRGLFEQEVQYASTRSPLKVGVIDFGTAYMAGIYFGKREIPIDLSYEDDLATAESLLRAGRVQAVVGSSVKRDRSILEADSVASVALDLPFRVPTGYGYLAFATQSLNNTQGVVKAVEHAAANEEYKQILAEFGMQALYIEGSIYRSMMEGIGSDRCERCTCESDPYCRAICSKCR